MKRSNFVMSLLVLGLVPALVACGETAAPGGTTPTVATTTEIGGSLADYPGAQVRAITSVDEITPGLVLDSVPIAEDGTFTIPLPSTVDDQFLAPVENLLGCADLPDTNVTAIWNIDVEDANGNSLGSAILVPEGSTTGTQHDYTYAFVYSDTDVQIDTTCTPTTTAGLGTRGVSSTYNLYMSLVTGWNVVKFDPTATTDSRHVTDITTSPLIAILIWLLYAA